ncbi:unnamed protein product [Adineta ricciae]|uniref:Uncharacterized protein n=1 Tax=Adineta ricciae TaxID=249248 RepID=A0A814AHW7_ADIRI|nr:unnamed protein product [Adineta ricciae]
MLLISSKVLTSSPTPTGSNRITNTPTTNTSSTTTLLTKTNLLTFHHLQHQFDDTSTNSVGILYIHSD